MPDPHFFFVARIYLLVAAASTATMILTGNRLHRWRSIFAFCVLNFCADVVLAASPGRAHYTRYFYTYWTRAICEPILRCWILFDLIKFLPNAEFLSKHLRIFTLTAGTVFAVGFMWFASLDGKPLDAQIWPFARWLDTGVLISWSAFVFAAVISVWTSRVRWDVKSILIAVSVEVPAILGLVVAHQLHGNKQARNSAGYINTIADMFELTLWCVATTEYFSSDKADDVSWHGRSILCSVKNLLRSRRQVI